MESRKYMVTHTSGGVVNILETSIHEQRAHFQPQRHPVSRKELPLHSYRYTNMEEKQKKAVSNNIGRNAKPDTASEDSQETMRQNSPDRINSKKPGAISYTFERRS